MTRDDMIIYFPKDLLTLSGYDFAVYSYLSIITFDNMYEDHYFTVSELKYRMGLSATKIKESLDNIIKTGYFDIEQISNYEYVLKDNSIRKMVTSFISWKFHDIETIVKFSYAYKYKLVALYVQIVAAMDYRIKSVDGTPFLTYMPISYFAEKLDINPTTVCRYEKDLERIGVFYIYRSDHQTNIVGFIKYASEIDHYAEKRVKQSTKTNDRRSLMQKYNWMRRGKCYSPEETEEIRQYVIQYNHNMQALQDRFPEGDYKAKIKDLTVFNIDKITA